MFYIYNNFQILECFAILQVLEPTPLTAYAERAKALRLREEQMNFS